MTQKFEKDYGVQGVKKMLKPVWRENNLAPHDKRGKKER